MNVVKRRWPDLLIGLLVVLLLAGFAALLLGKNKDGSPTVAQTQNSATQSAATPDSAAQSTTMPAPTTQTSDSQTPSTPAPAPTAAAPSGGVTAASPDQAAGIPTIPATPVTGSDATSGATTTAPDVAPATAAAPAVQGAAPISEARAPTRNDYRISLGTFADAAAVKAATSAVGKLGYTVYPVSVTGGVVAELGPFATREAAAQALADAQRAMPGAVLYSPRNAPATGTTGTTASGAVTGGATASAPTPSGPVYLQVGAYNTTAGAQTGVDRARALGLEPSVNAPAGKKVTVVVGPFQGRALADAEAKLEAGGIDYFRVR